MKVLLIVLFLFSSSCSYNLGIVHQIEYAGYSQEIEAVMTEWEADTTLPSISRSRCSLDNLYVAFPNDQQFTQNSGYCPPNACMTCESFCAAAYFLRDSRPNNSKTEYYLVMAAALTEEEKRSAVMHESLHWLSACTNHEDLWVENQYMFVGADMRHRDPRLWGPMGILAKLGI